MRLQPRRPLRHAALIVLGLTLSFTARAQETWTLSDFYDGRNDVRVRIAAIKNTRGDQVKVHAVSNESRVWVTFLPSPQSPSLGSMASLSWWCADGPRRSREAVTRTLAQRSGEPPSTLYHAGPHYVSFVLEHSDGLDVPTGPVATLQACEGWLSLGYVDTEGQLCETRFAVDGIETAIGTVIKVIRH